MISYKALDVKDMEKTKGCSIEDIVTNPTIENIEYLLIKGMGKTKNDIIEEIDDLLKEHTKTGLMMMIMEALVEGGFLDEQILKLAKQYQARLAEAK